MPNAAPSLTTKLEERILTLTLSRLERKNALDRELVAAITSELSALAERSDVDVLVVTGAGGAFCSGADLRAIEELPSAERPTVLAEFQSMILGFVRAAVPVIAAVDGAAAGFGADLAMAADLRVLGARSYLEWSFTKIGLCPDGGGTASMHAALGPRAFEVLALGRRLSAAECLSLGLANQLADDDQVLTTAHELARQLKARGPLGVRAVKRLVNAEHLTALERALEREGKEQLRLLETEDFTEGVHAFRERRTPIFRGR